METEIVDIESTALAAPGLAERIGTIQTPEQYAKAGEFVVWIKDLRKAVAALCNPKIAIKHQEHQHELDEKKRLDTPLARAEGILEKPMRDYLALERRQREEATRIAEAAARKTEEDARLAEAEAAEQAGAHEEAEAIIQMPVIVPSVVVHRAVPKVAGLATKKEWKWKITNRALIQDAYWIPRTLDEKAINRTVQDRKTLHGIHGIEVWDEDVPIGARR